MRDLKYDLKHLKSDVQSIHSDLEHLNSHSKICNELVKESNLREATELFKHLNQIDELIIEVEKHITHINEHIEKDSTDTKGKEIMDIEDLKLDAKHTSMDMKDIHSHIEHLITHSNMCQDILTPSAKEELILIKQHLSEIDEKAHELLAHVKSIRGGISSKYPEFIWPIPLGKDQYLMPTTLIDSEHEELNNVALKLVDGVYSINMALINILCFVRDFISPTRTRSEKVVKASTILESQAGGGIARSILACALARAVNIPSRIHFWELSPSLWQQKLILRDIEVPKSDFTLGCPEFLVNDNWQTVHNLLSNISETSCLHERYYELGIAEPKIKLDIQHWHILPFAYLKDNGAFSEPNQFLISSSYLSPPQHIAQRLFGGYIYTGNI